jgi:hypothetical protein
MTKTIDRRLMSRLKRFVMKTHLYPSLTHRSLTTGSHEKPPVRLSGVGQNSFNQVLFIGTYNIIIGLPYAWDMRERL